MGERKLRGGRRGAVRVKDPDPTHAMYPYIMKRRNESLLYFEMEADATKLLQIVRQSKKGEPRLTAFTAVMVAAVKTLYERPRMNRYIAGRRLYQKEKVDVGFLAKRSMNDDAEDINIIVQFEPEDTPMAMVARVNEAIAGVKDGETDNDPVLATVMKFPRFILRRIFSFVEWLDFYGKYPKIFEDVDPMRTSLFFSNLGSINVDACYHHLYDWGTCSIFATVGRIKKMPFCLDDGRVVARTVVQMRFTVDERVADGYYIAKSINRFKKYIENPAFLFPEISAEEVKA